MGNQRTATAIRRFLYSRQHEFLQLEGQARRVPRRAAQVKEAATAKRPRRGMHSPSMPASKPPCVATAQSWPTAPAGDGRTQCDSMRCSTRPGRVPPVGSGLPTRRQPASLPSCHRPGRTGPGPIGRTSGPRRLSGRFLADGGGTLHHFSQKTLVTPSISVLRIQSSQYCFGRLPCFAVRREPKIHRSFGTPVACATQRACARSYWRWLFSPWCSRRRSVGSTYPGGGLSADKWKGLSRGCLAHFFRG